MKSNRPYINKISTAVEGFFPFRFSRMEKFREVIDACPENAERIGDIQGPGCKDRYSLSFLETLKEPAGFGLKEEPG